MSYKKPICGHEECEVWKRQERAEHTVRRLEEMLDRAYDERRAAAKAYTAHLDRLAEAA